MPVRHLVRREEEDVIRGSVSVNKMRGEHEANKWR